MARKPPIPGLQEKRKLRREHPHLETHEIARMAGVQPTGITPMWATHGPSQKAAFYRRDPRDARNPKKE